MRQEVVRPSLRVGVVFRPEQEPESLRAVACAAESAGFDEIWVWEDCFFQGAVAQAAAALAWTTTISVGIGVLPVPQRNVTVTAMEISSLVRMFPGRVRIGIGHGEQDWMEQVGEKVASPMTLLREHLVALQGLLSGQTVTTTGRHVRIRDVGLGWPPHEAVPILLAARGPKTLALSGEVASGTILDCLNTPSMVEAASALLSEARSVSSERPSHSTVMYLACAPGDDYREQLGTEAAFWGFEPADQLGVGGTSEQIAQGAASYVAAGVDTIVFQPSATEQDYEGYIASVAGAVPLLRSMGSGMSAATSSAEGQTS